MVFKEENYTPMGRCLCVLIGLLMMTTHLGAQSATIHCPIRVDYEPRAAKQSRTPNLVDEQPFPFFTSWQNLDNLRASDDQYTSVDLAGYRQSTVISGSLANFDIPDGAEISGVEIFIEGFSTGSGSPEGQIMQLTNAHGEPIGQNYAQEALPTDHDWPATSDSTDFVWRYGSSNDTWGLTLNDLTVNESGFGYALQVRNKLADPITLNIDQIRIVVHFTPLYSICSDHACVPFYVTDGPEDEQTYEWYLPQGWELISTSEHDSVINIAPSYATFGTYEICVEAFKNEVSQGTCCRSYNYEDCDPGTISGAVFNDQNGSFTRDIDDELVASRLVFLYSINGSLVSSTTTMPDGTYSFEVGQGSYYISVEVLEGETFVLPNIGDDQEDSDITNAFGLGTSDLIELASGQLITNIDAGISQTLSIGDFVWDDLNGDGIQQESEKGIANIQVELRDQLGTEYEIKTNQEGFYQFAGLPAGEYTINFVFPSELVPSISDAGIATEDNDFDGTPINLSYPQGGTIDSIDAGFYKPGQIGDYVWEDSNVDGIQDSTEVGIEGIKLCILDQQGNTLDSTETDEDGAYLFDNLAPGQYTIKVDPGGAFVPTLANQGTNDAVDSDGTIVDGMLLSPSIEINSWTSSDDIDFGLILQPARLSGFTWIDSNADGQVQLEEQLLSGVLVSLYTANGNLVQEEMSDLGGFFQFTQIVPGDYYVTFDQPSVYLFTTPNQGDELSDSDVDGSNGGGSTAVFTLIPDDDKFDLAAGYVLRPKVGDFVWEDLNGNGIQDEGEPGLNGITVNLFSDGGELIASQITSDNPETDERGYYLFDNLDLGSYYLQFEVIDTFPFAMHVSDSLSNNSDVTSSIADGSTDLFTLVANECNLDIDAGYSATGKIGNFVWKDLNENGIQDEGEPGIEGAQLFLVVDTFTKIDSTSSDENGFYQFTDVAPGTYDIRVEFIPRLTLTGVNNGDDPTLDSDGIPLLNGFIKTLSSIDIESRTCNNDVDFGFFDTPSRLGGIAWLDSNADGIYLNEEILNSVSVTLFDETNTEVENTTTSEEGFYVFNDIAPGNYYVVFDQPDSLLFTLADQTTEDIDSDVTEVIQDGSTDLITIIQGDQFFDVNAGYIARPKVGNFVWIDDNRNGLQDEDEVGLSGVEIQLFDQANMLVATTTSGINPQSGEDGYYIFDNLDLGDYYIIFPAVDTLDFTDPNIEPDSLNSDAVNVDEVGKTALFTLVGNECNFNIDAGYTNKTSSITGEVFVDANEDGQQEIDDLLLEGIEVILYTEGGLVSQTTTTADDGSYRFDNVFNGVYYIVFNYSDRYLNTVPLATADPTIDSDIDNSQEAGSTSLITVVGPDLIENIDGGLIDRIGMISGKAWTDRNADGIYQESEEPISFQLVRLFDLDGNAIELALTDPDGSYMFPEVEPGKYYIQFEMIDTSMLLTEANVGINDTIDSDLTELFGAFTSDTLMIMYDQKLQNLDGGFYTYATIGNYAFIDNNENGVNDSEPGLDGVIVNLLDQTGTPIMTTTTAQGGGLDSGYYLFENVVPGTYQLEFVRPLTYQFISPDQGGDDQTDSDVVSTTNNVGSTTLFSVESGETNTSLDAGFIFQTPMESSIAGQVWVDTNLDGINDITEIGVENIEMVLIDGMSTIIETVLTDPDGNYSFDNLTEGFYTVQVVNINGSTATLPNQGGDDSVDSDFMIISNVISTEEIFLAIFEDLEDVDLGLVPTVTIGDLVWEDSNLNGSQEVTELGIANVEVTINSISGTFTQTTVTNEVGSYSFSDIPAGTYIVCIAAPDGFSPTLKNQGVEALDSDANPDGCTDPVTVISGSNFDIDFGLTQNVAIEGQAFVDLNGNGVFNGNDPGLDGIPVRLYNQNAMFVEETTTATIGDTIGYYTFTDIAAGSYYVEFEFPEDYIYSNGNVGLDETDSDITGVFGIGTTDLVLIPSGETLTDFDGGAYLPACIGNFVWEDLNMDGLQDENEPGVEGIEVIIFRSFGIPFDTVYTDANGEYKVPNLKQGLYFIQFIIPQDKTISPSDIGISDDIDSDADETGKTPLISLAHAADLRSVDCGIFCTPMASLRSTIWEDLNGDGLRQISEARIPDVRVTLYDENDDAFGSTTSNSLGLYAFQQIPAGEYKIFVDLAGTDYAFTDRDMGDDLIDSDINPDGWSATFTSAQFLSVPNVDVGLMEDGNLSSNVWNDHNLNGTYDENESAMAGIHVKLHHADGTIARETVSSSNMENVVFENLRPGPYYMTYHYDQKLASVRNSVDLSSDYDNDAEMTNGTVMTSLFQIESARDLMYVDAGFKVQEDLVEANHELQKVPNETEISTPSVNNEKVEIDICPNPATNYVRVKVSDTEGATVSLLNAEKRLIMKSRAADAETIDLQDLHPGVYYITIEKEGFTESKKFIKIH